MIEKAHLDALNAIGNAGDAVEAREGVDRLRHAFRMDYRELARVGEGDLGRRSTASQAFAVSAGSGESTGTSVYTGTIRHCRGS